MKAAVLTSSKRFDLVDVSDPKDLGGQVLVRVLACGVCRSELHVWKNPKPGKTYPPGFPGHEVLGEVADRNGNNAFSNGDLVAVVSFPGQGYSEYIKVPANRLLKLPTGCRDIFVLGEPIACAVNIINRFQMHLGQRVLIIGAGFLGNLILKVMRAKTDNFILCVDTRESARQTALNNGANEVLDPSGHHFQEIISEHFGERKADIVIEAAGFQETLDLATDAVGFGGTIVVAGMHYDKNRIVNMQKWNWKGITVINAHERDEEVYMEGLREGFRMLEDKKIKFDMVNHFFKLEQINQAFTMLDEMHEGYLKGIIQMTQSNE